MPCPDFEGKEYLFLSDELKKFDRLVYLRHIKQCTACREKLENARFIWDQIRGLPKESPSPEVRNRILDKAFQCNKQAGLSAIQRNRIKLQFITSRSTWRFATVIAMGLLFIGINVILFRSFRINRMDSSQSATAFTWQDDFYSEVSFLDSEINRVDSGQLLVNYFSEDEKAMELDDHLSTMSEDIDWIRSEIDNLMENLFGI
jgi:cbb3-type cytochrome oxidase subunit 3